MSKNTARRLDDIDKTISRLDETLLKLDDSLSNIAKSMGRGGDGPFKFKAESRDTLLGRLKSSAPAGSGDAGLFNQLKETLTKNHKESFELFKSMEKVLKSIEEKTGKGGGEGGGSVLGDVGKAIAGGGDDKKAKGKGSKVGKLLSGAGRVLSKAALPLAAGMAAVDAYSGYNAAAENLEIEGREPTFGEKLSSSAGSVVSGLSFGLLDSKKASKGIAGFFGAGPGKDKKAEAVASAAASAPAAAATTPTTAPSAAAPAVKATVAAAAPAAKEPTVTPGAKSSKSKPSAASKMEGEENLEKLQKAEGELQGLYSEMKSEKAKVSEKLANDTKNYPEGFIDDPSSPEYPKELKAVDDKYTPKIEAKKKEIEELSKAPGIDAAKKAQAAESLEGDSVEKPTASPKEKIAGKTEITKQTSTEQVSGGGETTTKRVQTAEAQAAEKELAQLDDKQAAERKEVVDKLKSEGKITGRFAKSSDFETIPELKELKAKQDAERAEITSKIDSGTSIQTSSVAPPTTTTTTSATTVSSLSAENKDLTMEASKGGTPAVISSNNVQNNNTTSFTPVKTNPRGGTSSLERKLDSVASM